MTGPNMATITASLERSLQNFSLNNNHHQSSTTSNSGIGRSDSSENHVFNNNLSDATLDLNSDISLPYHWEQCLDLKTGEIYYINWRTGMKVKEDPRTSGEEVYGGDLYSEEEYDSSYDSDEGSSSEELTSFSSSRQQQISHGGKSSSSAAAAAVLVVGGCKSCLMYFMVPKEVEDCPKCCGQLLHFDRSENGSP